MTETQAVAPAEQAAGASPVVEGRYEGRYIPYSGGCMGWFENSGVLKTEIPNNYTFYAAIDSNMVRARQFERAGKLVNKRRVKRKEIQPEMSISIVHGGESKPAVCKDLSVGGTRFVIVDEEMTFKKDDKVTCQFPDKSGHVLIELVCTVMWVEKAGRMRTIWSVGVAFPALTSEQEGIIKKIGDIKDDA
jgi:hypothetical protein